MCLLWMLLQFVVLAMYWDVPPISSVGTEEVLLEMKRECGGGEEEDEGVPLIGSDEEPANSYSAVSCSRSAEEQSACASSAESNVFRNFSVSRGELQHHWPATRRLCSCGFIELLLLLCCSFEDGSCYLNMCVMLTFVCLCPLWETNLQSLRIQH